MKWRQVGNGSGTRTYVVILEMGNEVMERLRLFAEEANIESAHFTAIGAFSNVKVGFFDIDSRDYVPILVDQQVEVLSMVGNVALHEGKPKIHAHVVVAKRDGSAHGGHLLEARVRPTLEVIVVETPANLQRYTDRQTGLALLSSQ